MRLSTSFVALALGASSPLFSSGFANAMPVPPTKDSALTSPYSTPKLGSSSPSFDAGSFENTNGPITARQLLGDLGMSHPKNPAVADGNFDVYGDKKNTSEININLCKLIGTNCPDDYDHNQHKPSEPHKSSPPKGNGNKPPQHGGNHNAPEHHENHGGKKHHNNQNHGQPEHHNNHHGNGNGNKGNKGGKSKGGKGHGGYHQNKGGKGGNAQGGNGGQASGGKADCSQHNLIGINILNLSGCQAGNGGTANGGSAFGGAGGNSIPKLVRRDLVLDSEPTLTQTQTATNKAAKGQNINDSYPITNTHTVRDLTTSSKSKTQSVPSTDHAVSQTNDASQQQLDSQQQAVSQNPDGNNVQVDFHKRNILGGSAHSGKGGSAKGGDADGSQTGSLLALELLNIGSYNGGSGGFATSGDAIGGKAVNHKTKKVVKGKHNVVYSRDEGNGEENDQDDDSDFTTIDVGHLLDQRGLGGGSSQSGNGGKADAGDADGNQDDAMFAVSALNLGSYNGGLGGDGSSGDSTGGSSANSKATSVSKGNQNLNFKRDVLVNYEGAGQEQQIKYEDLLSRDLVMDSKSDQSNIKFTSVSTRGIFGGKAASGKGGHADGGDADGSQEDSLLALSALNLFSYNGGEGGVASSGDAIGGKAVNHKPKTVAKGKGQHLLKREIDLDSSAADQKITQAYVSRRSQFDTDAAGTQVNSNTDQIDSLYSRDELLNSDLTHYNFDSSSNNQDLLSKAGTHNGANGTKASSDNVYNNNAVLAY